MAHANIRLELLNILNFSRCRQAILSEPAAENQAKTFPVDAPMLGTQSVGGHMTW